MHATSLSDLILRSDESNPVDTRYFTGYSTVSIPTWVEVHKHSSYTNVVFNYNGTHGEAVLSKFGDFSPIAYDADRKYPRMTPIWDQPDPDISVVNQIRKDLLQAIPMYELIQAIPYEDAADVGMSFYEPTTIVAVCLQEQEYTADAVARFISKYLAECNGQQQAMMDSIDDMMKQFGISGIKFV